MSSFKWKQTDATITGLSQYNPDAFDGHAVEYFNPSNAQTANANIASWMQKLPVGFRSKAHRHTNAVIYQVHKGAGYTVINGEKFSWSKGDFFVVPNWAWHEHVTTSSEDAFLFSVSDMPIMEKFGLQREEAYPNNDGHQEIISEFEPLLP